MNLSTMTCTALLAFTLTVTTGCDERDLDSNANCNPNGATSDGNSSDQTDGLGVNQAGLSLGGAVKNLAQTEGQSPSSSSDCQTAANASSDNQQSGPLGEQPPADGSDTTPGTGEPENQMSECAIYGLPESYCQDTGSGDAGDDYSGADYSGENDYGDDGYGAGDYYGDEDCSNDNYDGDYDGDYDDYGYDCGYDDRWEW